MQNDDWPFDQEKTCGVITLRSIVFGGGPIIHVTHDADDHGWQFLGWEDADVAGGAIVHLAETVARDSTVLQIAGLPPGWHAWRRDTSSPWIREAKA